MPDKKKNYKEAVQNFFKTYRIFYLRLKSECKDCNIKAAKKWQKNNKEKVKK